tara:strand:- start:7660 stop:9531 length:1872 start_codon:yes stop_codon:yes gene_type:complete
MFDEIVAFANQGAAISLWLPVIIKTAVILTITFITLIPLMFIAWLVNWASSSAVKRAVTKMSSLSLKAKDLAREAFESGSEKLHIPPGDSSLYISLENSNDNYRPAELTELEGSIARLTHRVDRAPDLAANSEASKQNLMDSLLQNLDVLSKERDKIRVPQIPKIEEADANAKLRKQQALTALVAFVPLTILAVLINSALLDVFFSQLFAGKDVFGVPYSILISLVFSIIEAGVGGVLGLVVTSENKKSATSTSTICWVVIACLMCIELVLYFLVGTYNLGEIDPEDVSEMLSDGLIWLVIIRGGWFMLIGPAIVLSLYLFGHKLSVAYFEFNKYSNFDKFRKTMDDGHLKSEQFLDNVREGERVTKELILKIKEEEISLNNIDTELPASVKAYKKSLGDQLKTFNKSIESAANLEIKLPEIAVQKIGVEQSHELLKLSAIYLMLFVIAVGIGAMAFPIDNIPFLPNNWLSGFLLSSFIGLVCLVAGFMITPKLSVVRVDDSDVARFVVEKRGGLALWGFIVMAVGFTFFYWSVFSGVELFALRVSISVVINAACFYVGTRLLVSLSGWANLCSWLLLFVAGSFFNLCRLGIVAIYSILQLADELLGILAMPVKTTFGQKYES